MKNKRKTIIIGIFIFILVAVTLWFFAFLNKNQQKNIINETQNLFPFGKVEPGNGNNNNGNQGTVDKPGEQETVDEQVKPVITAGPRLRRINNFPTGGFAAIVRAEDKEITDVSINSDGISTQSTKTIQVENEYVRYSAIDDASIHETRVTPATLSEELLTENFIPNAEQVVFSTDGSKALFQYWNKTDRTIETYLGKIEKKKLDIKECPYSFKKNVLLGDSGEHVFNLHEFLNKNIQTRIAVSGINSPGNESAQAVPSTITAIKNFQSLHDLDIDGELGTTTQKKMLEVCDAEQKKIAEAEFNKLDTRYDISGFFLPQGITTLDINPKGDEFFYIQKDKIGVIGIVRNFINNKKETIFESPYSEWISLWNNEDNIEITTKASYQADGYSYGLNPNDHEYHKSFKQRKGLLTLASPNNENIFVSEIENNAVRTSIYTRKNNRIKPLVIQTFPEKCVWSPENIYLYCAVPDALAYGGEYPDTWYQGIETYNDSLWRIDSRTGKATVISDIPTEYNENLDIFKITIDKNSHYLYFIDKKSELLWSYRLIDA